jgi:hypothetical protein
MFMNGGHILMTVTENIQHYVQMLPDSLQVEVLDFVKYLLFKRERETVQEQAGRVAGAL